MTEHGKNQFRAPLTDEQLDRLWEEAQPYMSVGDTVEAALSGKDPVAAGSLFFWFSKCSTERAAMPPQVREYADRAFARYASRWSTEPDLTLDEAFGLKPLRRGATRAGVRNAIEGLVGFLRNVHGFHLGAPDDDQSAYYVASLLLQRKWRRTLQPATIQTQRSRTSKSTEEP